MQDWLVLSKDGSREAEVPVGFRWVAAAAYTPAQNQLVHSIDFEVLRCMVKGYSGWVRPPLLAAKHQVHPFDTIWNTVTRFELHRTTHDVMKP